MTTVTVPRWAPRLARLYAAEIAELEVRHAGHLHPGAATWQEAVEGIYARMIASGPAKGVKIMKAAADYLSAAETERAHMVLEAAGGKRRGRLVFASLKTGNHPDGRVVEDGMVISAHLIECSRKSHGVITDLPVVFVPTHALRRLYERCDGLDDAKDVSVLLSFISVLGIITCGSARLSGSGLHLRIGDLLLAGAVHEFGGRFPGGPTAVYDVRTVLEVDQLGADQKAMLAQGEAAMAAVALWLKGGGDDEETIAGAIPVLPRRSDHWSARAAVPAKKAGGDANEPLATKKVRR